MVLSHQGGFSHGWSLIWVDSDQGGLHSGGLPLKWSHVRVVFHKCGLSLGWSVVKLVFHQAGLSSLRSFVKLVSHHCSLSSSWSLITAVFRQESAVHAIIMETGCFDSHAMTPGFQAPLSQRRKKWSTAWSTLCRPGTPSMDR